MIVIPKRPSIDDQETEKLPLVRRLTQHRDTDPYATTPALPVVHKMPPFALTPRSVWKSPFYVRKTYQDPLTLVVEALDYCWHRHHGRIAHTVYLPQHLFCLLYYPEGQRSVTYRRREVAILGDPALAITIVWCVGE